MQRNCIFPGRYAPLTYYEDALEASRNTLMARNAGKFAISLHTCISITDKAIINEQNKTIAVGPFYISPTLNRYGHSYLKMWRCGRFEPYGVSDLVTSVPRMCNTPKLCLKLLCNN